VTREEADAALSRHIELLREAYAVKVGMTASSGVGQEDAQQAFAERIAVIRPELEKLQHELF